MYEPLRGVHAKHLSPYGRVVPFTYRDSKTFIGTLEDIRDYVVNVIVPHIDKTFTDYNDEISALIDTLNSAIDSVSENVDISAGHIATVVALISDATAAMDDLQGLIADAEGVAAGVTADADAAAASAAAAHEAIAAAADAARAVLDAFTVEWGDITGMPEEFPPSAHRHSADEIDGVFTADSLPVATTEGAGIIRIADGDDIAAYAPDAALTPEDARLVAERAALSADGSRARRLAYPSPALGMKYIERFSADEDNMNTAGVYRYTNVGGVDDWYHTANDEYTTIYEGTTLESIPQGSYQPFIARAHQADFTGPVRITVSFMVIPSANFGGRVECYFGQSRYAISRRINVSSAHSGQAKHMLFTFEHYQTRGYNYNCIAQATRDSTSPNASIGSMYYMIEMI